MHIVFDVRVITFPRHHSGISKKLGSAMWNELASHMLMQLRNTKWKLFKFASYGHDTYIYATSKRLKGFQPSN